MTTGPLCEPNETSTQGDMTSTTSTKPASQALESSAPNSEPQAPLHGRSDSSSIAEKTETSALHQQQANQETGSPRKIPSYKELSRVLSSDALEPNSSQDKSTKPTSAPEEGTSISVLPNDTSLSNSIHEALAPTTVPNIVSSTALADIGTAAAAAASSAAGTSKEADGGAPHPMTSSSNASSAEGQQGSDQSGLDVMASLATAAKMELNEASSKAGNIVANPVPSTIEVTRHRSRKVEGKSNPGAQPLAPAIMIAPRTSLAPRGSTKSKASKPSGLRRGKWTVEEETYVARVIQDFNSGFLDAPAGTTLRSYLSTKLHCDPMRITKKFTGDACIGKRVFHPAVRCPSNAFAIDKAQAELLALERRWLRRLEMQQRESAKKAAASAAAAAAAAACGHGSTPFPSSEHPPIKKVAAVTQTASWLDRANAILARQQQPPSALQQPRVTPPANQQQDIEMQMREVQRLIHEGPVIQQATAGLTTMMDQQKTATNHDRPASPGSPTRLPPSEKRPRRLSESGAADAEALIGFFNSVRAHSEPVATNQQSAGN